MRARRVGTGGDGEVGGSELWPGGKSNKRKSVTNSLSSYATDSLWALGQVRYLLWVSVSPSANKEHINVLFWL